ncbi:hypothetical protein HanHA300_Chr03g0102521 [Helianthus annuus]|nr:hypothetical protein HanHA300_Chr03g0102521 [Helianthus annuus]KAJ0608914.1 hypothetical protein HanHA89_Chr03g0114201 [Helianthus annuus]
MLLYMIYIILCHSDHFLGIGDLFFSIFFDLVCWYAIRFGVEGLPRSSLSIPRDRGKVCLDPTLPDPISSFAICGIHWELGVSLEAASLSPGIEVRLAYIPPSPDPTYSQLGYRWDYTGYGCCCCCCLIFLLCC